MTRPSPPSSFIGEPIEVRFEQDPLLRKKAGCPSEFIWRGEVFHIQDVLREWHAYGRSGRMEHNMAEPHALAAARRGSWGVGKDYYRVLTWQGRTFVLYYDRAPKDIDNRLGGWFLREEILSAQT